MLVGAVVVRVRDLIRQIAMEHELTILSGKVALDHVHAFVSYRAHQDISTIVQWLKGSALGYSFRSLRSAEDVLGQALLGSGLPSGHFGHDH